MKTHKLNFKLGFLTTSLVIFLAPTLTFAQEAKELLRQDLQKGVKVLASEKRVYNYFFMQQNWPELATAEGRKNFAGRYLTQRANTFLDANFNDDNRKNYACGAGLYFAIDPLISETYGNTYVEMTIPAGSKYINVVAPITIQKNTILNLIKENYVTADDVSKLLVSGKGFYRDTLRSMVSPQYIKFRTLVQEIFNEEDIRLIEYNFNSNLNGICKKASFSAFNLIKVIDPTFNNVNLYSSHYEFANKSSIEINNFSRIEKFKQLMRDIINLQKSRKPITESFLLSKVSPEELIDFRNKSYSCQQR